MRAGVPSKGNPIQGGRDGYDGGARSGSPGVRERIRLAADRPGPVGADAHAARARVGLVATACMTMPEQPPFHVEQPDNDPSIRIVSRGTDPAVLVITFSGQAFDHAGLAADANLLVPLDRLREMGAAGEIGELAPRAVSLCGHLPKPRRLIDETAPEIARMFIEDGADAVVLVPA